MRIPSVWLFWGAILLLGSLSSSQAQDAAGLARRELPTQRSRLSPTSLLSMNVWTPLFASKKSPAP